MRAYSRYAKRGFTLVELMIVVAIIGVLAALAGYGVYRYYNSAKTAEATNALGAISRGAAEAFEREIGASELLAAGQQSGAPNHALCLSATPVPQGNPAPGKKYRPDPVPGKDFNTGDQKSGWKCLKFDMNDPIAYQYHYYAGSGYVGPAASGPDPGADGFEAAAKGDLDGDGIYSTFTLTGKIDGATKTLTRATRPFIDNEYE